MGSIGGIIAAMSASTCGDAATGEAVAGPQHVSTPAPCAALLVGAVAYLLSELTTLFAVPALHLILSMCDTQRSLQMQAFQTDDSVHSQRMCLARARALFCVCNSVAELAHCPLLV